MTQMHGAPGAETRSPARRPHIETLLARYPQLDDAELAELKRWFRREASPLEVGMMAAEPDLAEPYRRFAADHLEPLTLADYLRLSAFAGLVVAAIAAIALFVY